jgi:hypothetical protein
MSEDDKHNLPLSKSICTAYMFDVLIIYSELTEKRGVSQ